MKIFNNQQIWKCKIVTVIIVQDKVNYQIAYLDSCGSINETQVS